MLMLSFADAMRILCYATLCYAGIAVQEAHDVYACSPHAYTHDSTKARKHDSTNARKHAVAHRRAAAARKAAGPALF